MDEVAKTFLVPAGLLVTALGVAKTEWLKTAVSGIGLTISGLWFCALVRLTDFDIISPYFWLPMLFAVAASGSLFFHGRLAMAHSGKRQILVDEAVMSVLSEDGVKQVLAIMAALGGPPPRLAGPSPRPAGTAG